MEFMVAGLPFLVAGLLAAFGQRLPLRVVQRVTVAVMLALFGWLVTLVPEVTSSGAITRAYPWVPSLGLTLELYLDGLALLFALLITGIGAAVFAYAGSSMEGHPHARRFFVHLSAFAGSMLGVVLAGNLLLLFVCWELTSIFSYLLIGFDGDNPRARSAATQALVITGGGGLALLAGFVLIGTTAGSFGLPELLATPLQSDPWYTAITLLVLLGCFTKSAQVPFHFWLPGGMTAPTPASAYLHSATMVKAGVYLLARLYPVLGDTPLWTTALTAVGALTMLVGAVIAPRQRDLKGILAYATVSWLGALVLLLGLPGYGGFAPAMIGIVAHALYKSPLFMVAGAIDHATGTRLIDRLGGLARRAPDAAGVTVVAALSMAGVLPLLGFVAKESLLEALLDYHGAAALPILAAVAVAAAGTVVAALLLSWEVFFRPEPLQLPPPAGGAGTTLEPPGTTALHYHRPPRLMMLGPGVVAALSLVVALAIPWVLEPLVALATPVEVSVYLWHGFNPAFALSLGILAAGTGAFLVRERWRSLPVPTPLTGAGAYGACRTLLNRAGDLVLRLQDGKLSHYLAVLFGVVGVLIAVPAYQYVGGGDILLEFRYPVDIMRAALLLLSLVAVLASVVFRGHLLAALALGVAGYAVGGIYLLEPAPDVAAVQVVVETLGAVLLVVMLSRISERTRKRAADALWGRGRGTVARDVLISTLVGLGVAAFALAALVNRPSRDSVLADWYLDNAQLVGVTDVVGSLITDFRAMDTLVEITVFAMSAMGVLTVLHLRRKEDHRRGDAAQLAAEAATRPLPSLIATPLTRYAATLLLPVASVIAIAHLLYAGDAPGDGFTAGVIGGISVALWYQVFGFDRHRPRGLRAEGLIGAGLTIALVNALAPLVFGHRFLQHDDFGDLPLPAGLHFSSATVLEFAIFLTVLGSVITMLNAIMNPEGIEQR